MKTQNHGRRDHPPIHSAVCRAGPRRSPLSRKKEQRARADRRVLSSAESRGDMRLRGLSSDVTVTGDSDSRGGDRGPPRLQRSHGYYACSGHPADILCGQTPRQEFLTQLRNHPNEHGTMRAQGGRQPGSARNARVALAPRVPPRSNPASKPPSPGRTSFPF